jgi:cytochrome c553
MTVIDRRHPLCTLVAMSVLACVSMSAAAAELIDLRGVTAVQGDAAIGKSKAAVCSACHGPAGIAIAPTFPNLAGQQAEYLYWRLVAFKRDARPESPMTAQVATLDDATMKNLAAYFASLAPANGNGTSSDAADHGAQIYREGDPAHGVPPCQGCHGSDARGHPLAQQDPRWRIYPILRGQHAAYVTQRLQDLRDDTHALSSGAHIMAPIARSLDADAVKAVASWLENGAP